MTFDTSARVNKRKPQSRNLSGRAVVFAIDGAERPFPVYQFSRRAFPERPNHNAFAGGDFVIISVTPQIPSPYLGVPYTFQLEEEGSTGAVTWSVASGSLPGGLSLSAAGLISGTPTQTGLETANILASDAGPPVQSANQRISIQVNP